MRHTQPLTAEEQRLDAALRREGRTDRDADLAMTCYRVAQYSARDRDAMAQRVADVLLGEHPL